MPPALYFISYILILFLIPPYSLFLISYSLFLLIPYFLFLIPPYSLFLIPLRWNPNRKGSARCRSRQAQNQAALR